MVIVRALERGITLRDWEVLTFGMILDIIITGNNMNMDEGEDEAGERVRKANQADMDRF